MQWLTDITDEVEKRYPEGEILVSSGVSPSGKYHIGTLREVLTADAVLIMLRKRGREARHIHFVDDLDGLRKVPAGVPESFSAYLGKPVCDVPSPDESVAKSYADYYLNDFMNNVDLLGIDMEVARSHEKYRSGFFVPSIEKALANIAEARGVLEDVSGRKLGEEWSPIQVNEGGYLKKRPFVSIDTQTKEVTYKDVEGNEQSASYEHGNVKLDWRLDWPARWWQLAVKVEPFGRDHATKGGSYDTGVGLVEKVFGGSAPIPVPYQFINRSGETKKMSKSAGNTVTISELLEVLPPEIVRYFVLRFPASKQLFFDQTDGIVRLIDEYAELLAKTDKSPEDEALLLVCSSTIKSESTISNVPFSHLVASYQAALRDKTKTLDIIRRTEHAVNVEGQEATIQRELDFIDAWLDKWAPEDVRFELRSSIDDITLSEQQKNFVQELAAKIEVAPQDADGEWFHKAVYEFKETSGLSPKELFVTLYEVIIGQASGPRAGWFLSILPRDWLVKRLRLEA